MQEYQEAIRLSDRVFRDDGQASMGDAFPFLFSLANAQSYGAFEGGKLISFVGLVPAIIRVGSARLKVYSIGSVCTHPDERGRGAAGQILQQVLAHIDQAEASLMLVSGDRGLYRRIDCYPFGHTVKLALDEETARAALDQKSTALKIREMEAADILKVHELLDRREVRYEQSVWDTAKLIDAEAYAGISHMKHQVLIAEREGRAEAVLITGIPVRRDQRRALAVEWAGDSDAVGVLLCASLQQAELDTMDITIPYHDDLANSALLSRLDAQTDREQGTVHVVDPARLLEQLMPYLKEKDEALSKQLKVRRTEAGDAELHAGDRMQRMSPSQWVSLIFDETPEDGIHSEVTDRLRPFFPIPFAKTDGLNYV